MLREAGALEVHVRISSPPVSWPCFYGIDFATRAELVANGLDTEGIRRSIGADSLGYVSLAGLIAATEQPKTRLCRACFDGEYPIGLPAGDLIGKHVLEGVGKRVTLDADAVNGVENDYQSGAERSAPGAKSLVGSPGGGDALHRP
jgi:amidophosphoribosyltransferase